MAHLTVKPFRRRSGRDHTFASSVVGLPNLLSSASSSRRLGRFLLPGSAVSGFEIRCLELTPGAAPQVKRRPPRLAAHRVGEGPSKRRPHFGQHHFSALTITFSNEFSTRTIYSRSRHIFEHRSICSVVELGRAGLARRACGEVRSEESDRPSRAAFPPSSDATIASVGASSSALSLFWYPLTVT
jgi:hypothetical protein